MLENQVRAPEPLRILETHLGKISYTLVRSSRRRTMEISIPATTHACVTAPRFVSLAIIEKFIYSRSQWIIRKISEQHQTEQLLLNKKYEHGHEFLFLGKHYPLFIDLTNSSSSINFNVNGWNIALKPDAGPPEIKAKLIDWYRREAGEIFGGRIFHYSRIMGLAPQKITVKTQKRLWGSCNHHGRSINLNWVLIMAPLEVIDYVVVHELCHLEVPNHSQRFWKKVKKTMPDYKERERWLKTHSHEMLLPR